jgi:hypothetical protein
LVAKSQKVSMSSIVVDLLDTAIPVLKRVADLIEAARKAPQQALDELKLSLGRAENELQGMQDQVMGQLDLLEKEAGAAGDARERAAAAPASARRKTATEPPSSNRGVRKPTRAKNPALKGGAPDKKKRATK